MYLSLSLSLSLSLYVYIYIYIYICIHTYLYIYIHIAPGVAAGLLGAGLEMYAFSYGHIFCMEANIHPAECRIHAEYMPIDMLFVCMPWWDPNMYIGFTTCNNLLNTHTHTTKFIHCNSDLMIVYQI